MTSDTKIDNPYLRLVEDGVQAEETGLRESLYTAKDGNPDNTARALPLASKLKLPVSEVEANLDKYERQAAFEANDYLRIAKNYPSLSTFLRDTENAKLAHDDVGALTAVLDFGRSIPGGAVEAGGTAIRGSGALSGATGRLIENYTDPRYAPGLYVTGMLLRSMAPGAEQGGKIVQEFGRETVMPPQERQNLATDIGSGLGQVASYVTTAIMTGGTGALALGAAQGAGIQAERSDDAGATEGQKDAAVALGAVVTAATERVQLGVLLKGVPGMDKLVGKLPAQLQNKWLSKIIDVGGAGGAEAVQETVEGFLQDTVEYYVYNPDVEFMKEWQREAQAAGATGAIFRGLISSFSGRHSGTRGGQESQQTVEALNETAKASKLRGRSPERFRQAVAETYQGSVYVNAEGAQTFYQGLDPEDQARLNAAIPDFQQKVEQAAETGADVVLDRADYVSYIAGTDQGDTLAEYVKLSPADLSAFDEKQLAEELNRLPEDIDATDQPQGLEPIEQLEQRIFNMLRQTEERGSADVARVQSQLINLRALVRQARGDAAQEERLLTIFDSLTIQKAAPVQRDSTDSFLNEARKYVEARRKKDAEPPKRDLLGFARKKKEKAAPTPVISWLGQIGGIDPDNPIARELAAMDITPKSHKRLFKRGAGTRFDAIPVSEFRSAFDGNIEPVSSDGEYVDQDWLLEQIRDESFGRGALTPEQQAAEDRARQIDELESFLASNDLDIETASNEQIRAALEGAAGQEGQALFQSMDAPVFFSAVERAAQGIKQDKGTGDQFLAIIQKTGGVKEEEIAWTGLDQFLRGKRSVTKQEVLDYIAANKVEIQDVTLGGEALKAQINTDSKYAIPEVLRIVREHQGNADDALALVLANDGDAYRALMKKFPELQEDEFWEETVLKDVVGTTDNLTAATKFEQYTLPGGSNYREVLLTLPNQGAEFVQPEKITELPEGYSIIVDSSQPEGSQYGVTPPGQAHARPMAGRHATAEHAKIAALEQINIDAVNEANREYQRSAGDSNFRSSHFDQPNILAHVRLNDRTDSDGKRVLFVEEIQSDWHQAGRKKGYKGTEKVWGVYSSDGFRNHSAATEEEAKQWAEDHGYKPENVRQADKESAVPDAPLKKTWHEMAFRRIVRMAAEQGYDRVAWTTGEVQNERYDLSKQISEVDYKRSAQQLVAKDLNGEVVIKEHGVTDDKLEDYVGKDVAQRLISEGEVKDSVPGHFRLRGDGLKIGGDGMKGFYDKILPSYAKRFAKKFGSDVGTTAIVAPETAGQNDTLRYEVYDPDGQVYDAFPTLEGAQQAAQDNGPGFTVKSPDALRTVKTWSFDVTPAMREAALSEGFALFQPNRGQFQTFPDGRSVITAFEGQNLSTVIHEIGHFYSYLLRDMATQFPGSAWSEQWATVSGWWQGNAASILKEARSGQFYKIEKEPASGRFVVRGLYGKQHGIFKTRREAQSERDSLQTNLTVETTALKEEDIARIIANGAVTDAEAAVHIVMEEQFARGFEAYLMEGKAPSMELKQAFRRFKAWLIGIYKDVSRLNVKLSPEIRGVFDRLLATEDQIEAMRQLEAFQPDPTVAGVLNEAERAKYVKQSEEAVEWAKEKLFRDLMKEERKKATAEYKAERAKLLEENLTMLRESAAYKAQAAMADGTADPAVVADLHGFTSADEMQRALAGLEPLERRADRITDEEMKARHGDALTDGTIERAAVERMNEAEAGFDKSQAELRAAAQKAGVVETSKEALKLAAQRMHDQTTVRDATQSTRYMRAAVKAARMYGKAAAGGKWEDAAKWKRQQILNQRLYALARDADKEIEKAFNKWGRLTKKNEKDAAKVIDVEFLNAIRSILSKYGISKGRTIDTDRWLANIAAADPDLFDQLSQTVEVYTKGAKPYKDLTMDEFRELVAAVDNLIGVEKRRKEVEILGKKVLVEDAVDQIVQQIEGNLKLQDTTQDGRSKFGFKAARGLAAYLGLVKKMETYAQAMDGGKVFGVVHKFLRSEIAQAEARFVKRRHESAAEFQAVVEKHYKEGRGLEVLADRKDAISIPEIGDSYTRLEIITVALNTGNGGNIDRLLEGRNWKQEQLDAVLSHMRAKDWQFVQDTWDMINARWPEIAKDHRERYGYIPAKVEAIEALRQTADGQTIEVKGGYFPIKYDSGLSAAAQQAEQSGLMKEFGPIRYAKAQTRQGHKKERADVVKGRPLNLNGLAVISQHLDQVDYDLTMGKAIEDAAKLVRHNRFQKAVTDYMGTGVYQDIDLWLKDTAVGPLYSDGSALGRGARWLRTAYTGTRLALRFSTFMVQFTGLSNSVVAVGANWMRRGAVDFAKLSARDPMGAFKAVRAKSVFMETNFATLNRDVADTIQRLEGRGLAAQINKGMMLPMMSAQYAVNVFTWLGAYNRALYGEKLPEAEAIRYADLAVERSQGSGLHSTLSALERGTASSGVRMSEAVKLWTTLRSYFYTKMNLSMQRTKQTAKNPTPLEITKLAADYVILFWVEALVAEFLLGRWPDDDDEDKSVAMYLLNAGLSTAAAGLPGADMIYGKTQGFDAAPGAARPLEDIGVALADTARLFDDDAEINWYAYSRHSVTAGAYGLKLATGVTLPAAQINDFIRGLEKAADGEDVSVLDYLRYKKD